MATFRVFAALILLPILGALAYLLFDELVLAVSP